ncbi:MAG: DUF4041 domain-containing protein, partial [Candidatus Bipolaricaulota bacterium]|nr:DUF4041 domain-containing protein [Candidatus Bipolaricaulota bacterium]
MTDDHLVFNPPPGWPKPPDGWVPPRGWSPDPAWPDPPQGWQLWLPTDADSDQMPVHEGNPPAPESRPCSEAATTEATTVPAGVDTRIALLEAENAALRAQLDAVTSESDVVVLDDERVLQEVGIYRYHHPLENASLYKDRLNELSARIADIVKVRGAIEMSNTFTFDNSLAKGQKMSSDLGKLMLRAYNAEV